MAAGIAAALADSFLTTWAADALYVQLHTGDPGTDGTANLSSVTTREPVTWSTPSVGSVAATSTPTWSSWAGTDGEDITYISFWDAATAGTFYGSIAVGSTTVSTGANLSMSSCTVTLPVAS